MLSNLLPNLSGLFTILAYCFSFGLTVLLITALKDKMPHDGGRAFAVNGALSKGKPRGIGLLFVAAALASFLIFVPFENAELPIYCACILLAMLSGYFDDASEKPWNEYKKGAIDLVIALILAFTSLVYHGSTIVFALFAVTVTLPAWLYIILAVILIWASINVVNCTDGVDGLCGSLSVVTILGFVAVISFITTTETSLENLGMVFIMAVLGYLIFNASPSKVLMGDAGSRALGILVAILALGSDPFLFLLLAIVFILDGGLGLIKVSLLRFLKISIMKNIRTPLHDHFRKNLGWSDTQTVFRFVIAQAVIAIIICASIMLFYSC